MCKDLNLSLPGYPRAVQDVRKRKKTQPVDCLRCGLTLRDKYILLKHVSFVHLLLFFLFVMAKDDQDLDPLVFPCSVADPH
jgi:uncharacterized C2H2 Zn-finger protein